MHGKIHKGGELMGDVRLTSTPYDDAFRTLLND